MQITFTTSEYNGFHISCFGAKDGSITANVSGGTPPYTYQWSNEQTTATITGLSADFYNLVEQIRLVNRPNTELILQGRNT